MRALLLILLLLSTLTASDKELATKIYLSIAKNISHSAKPKFYLHNEVRYLSYNKQITTVSDCERADIVVVSKKFESLPQACLKRPVFVTKYRIYKKHPEVMGAFFWQKGRPNIIFRDSVLKAHGITLQNSFEPYIEREE